MSRTKNTDQTTEAPAVTGLDILQATADDVAAKGYSGIKPDGPANETFTLAGVIAAKETDQ